MNSQPHTPALRTSLHGRFGLLLAAAAALLLAATPVNALPALPAVDQSIDTVAGRIDASAGAHGAKVCSDLATPALPALPATPALPVPVAVPAVPTLAAQADACAAAGLDGASAQFGIDTPFARAGTGIDAKSPVSEEEVQQLADDTTGEAKGFLEGLIDTLFGWM